MSRPAPTAFTVVDVHGNAFRFADAEVDQVGESLYVTRGGEQVAIFAAGGWTSIVEDAGLATQPGDPLER
ncbi:hypothetical protein GCM10027418_06620 [Mariniluteicoccus endophyticus]